jgi:cysteine desulfurase
MLGFKLEAPRREGSMSDKVRPIYLDMQVLRLG